MNPTSESSADLKMFRNAVNHAINRGKETYFKLISRSDNSKELWRNRKSLDIMLRKETIIPDECSVKDVEIKS